MNQNKNFKWVIILQIIDVVLYSNKKLGIMYYQFQKDGKVIILKDAGKYFFGNLLGKTMMSQIIRLKKN